MSSVQLTTFLTDCQTLFGHTHRYGGLWKSFGFNVGVDLNHFRLFSEDNIMYMLRQKEKYRDEDMAIHS